LLETVFVALKTEGIHHLISCSPYATECPEIREYEIKLKVIMGIEDALTGEGFFKSFEGPVVSRAGFI
jgi:hypothetical protein